MVHPTVCATRATMAVLMVYGRHSREGALKWRAMR